MYSEVEIVSLFSSCKNIAILSIWGITKFSYTQIKGI